MRRANAAIGSSVFFIAAPMVVAGLIPWWLTRWDVRQPPLSIPFRVIGVAAIVVGAGVLVLAFVRFVVEGSGTPAPVAPTEQLVVGGLYRYVRNPMYLAVEAIILGQALVLGRLSLLWYGADRHDRLRGVRPGIRGARAHPPVRCVVRDLPTRRSRVVAAQASVGAR